ncbi:MAG: hypothetical protein LBC28_02505, partial [Oscillospiraceae bacterium]|nr:hypothetical protein [Oscillospiraceae bacterium]
RWEKALDCQRGLVREFAGHLLCFLQCVRYYADAPNGIKCPEEFRYRSPEEAAVIDEQIEAVRRVFTAYEAYAAYAVAD